MVYVTYSQMVQKKIEMGGGRERERENDKAVKQMD